MRIVMSLVRFIAELQRLQRQRSAREPRPPSPGTPDLERAAQLLRDLPAWWQHPGVTPEQRRELVREVIRVLIREVVHEIRLQEGQLSAVEPRPQYARLFGYSMRRQQRDAGGGRSP
jgi:hypothetical protein